MSLISSTTFHEKRQKFHKQIRHQYFKQFFSQKRKTLSKQFHEAQKFNTYLQRITKLINSLNLNSNQPTTSSTQGIISETIQNIHVQLLNVQSNNSLQKILFHFSSLFIKLFIATPNNIKSIQIFFMTIRQTYSNTYSKDNLEFQILQKSQFFHTSLQNIHDNMLTIYQQSVNCLYIAIDEQIDEILQVSCEDEGLIKKQKKCQINKKLILLFECLVFLGGNEYKYVKSQCFLRKYCKKWMKILILQKNIKIKGFLAWLVDVFNPSTNNIEESAIMILESFNQKQNKQITKNQSVLSNDNDEQILQRIFTWCIPSNKTIKYRSQPYPYLCLSLIKLIFEHPSILTQKILKYFKSLLNLIFIISNYQTYFNSRYLQIIYELIRIAIDRVVDEKEISKEIIENSNNQVGRLAKINIFQEIKSMQLLKKFEIYLQHESKVFQCTIYALIRSLCRYCIAFQIPLTLIFQYNNLFTYTTLGLQSEHQQILLESLNILIQLFEYSQRYGQNGWFVKFLSDAGDRVLQNLCYHKNQFIRNLAEELLQRYFTQEKIKIYTKCIIQEHQHYKQKQQDESNIDEEYNY